jgi:MFS transporter, SHS family, lactate transporter
MRNNMAIGWFYSPSQIKRYLLTRPSSLKPPGTKLRNPIAVLRELDRHQWLMFLAGFLGWTWDAFDFFTVSLTVTELAESFGKTNAQVSWVCGPLLVFATVRGESVQADDMSRG